MGDDATAPPTGDSITYLVPVGMLGGGFSEEYFLAALDRGVDFVAIDSGSTDGGPNNLGGDTPFFSRDALKRDLTILLTATRRADIPFLVGSCGGSGGDVNLDYVWDIVREVAAEHALSMRVALVHAEPDRAVLVEKFRAGRITPLDPAPVLTEDVLTDTRRIVAMMGPEPIQRALEGGADVVLAGRSSDAALLSAIPLMRGFDPGLTWHAAKIAECGGAAVTQMTKPEGMIATIRSDSFDLTPVSPEQSVSPHSVAAHALYETSNPTLMLEPGGAMLLDAVEYEQLDERSVRVRGSRFEPRPYTVKLEGATIVGHRSAVLGGVTDPVVLRDFDAWFERAKEGAMFNALRTLGRETVERCTITYKVYGRDAVLGDRETRSFANTHEVGVFMEVIGPDQQTARDVIATLSHTILHFAVPEWQGLVSNLAFPVAPFEMELGPAYAWTLNHVAHLDDPSELFTTTYEEVRP